MKKVFIDTSAFYGFIYKKDHLHLICRDITKYLFDNSFSFFTHKWIEYETLSKLKRHGIQYCEAFSRLIQKLDIYTFDIANDLEQNALELFWGYKDKKWSIIDCMSIALNYHQNVYYVFSSDNHFNEAGLFTLISYDQKGRPCKTFSILN